MGLWPFKNREKSYQTVPSNSGWRVLEAFTGAWQRNVEWRRDSVLAYHAVFSCVSLIASDIAKLKVKMVRNDKGIWIDIPYGDNKVLERPNSYQNRIQFYETWVLSKLIRGNTYVWKERASDGNVAALHVLNPDRVLPIVSDDGQVFYQLGQDNLSGIQETGLTVPASEIIHDRFNCFFHPLVGLSPLYASGMPAHMGLKATENSAKHFQNGARPSGILTIPEAISVEKATELSASWETNYGGDNYGKVAVMGGDLKYQPLSMTAEESQMVEQLKLTAEMVCSTFHVPAYKVIGNAPAYNNIEALEQAYYSQCLQILIESMEECLDRGLNVKEGTGTRFDLDNLLRMDSKSQVETLGAGVNKAIYAPNEARRKMNMKPVDGGDVPFLQQQNWPISMLANRSIDELNGDKNEPVVDEEKQLMMLAMLVEKEITCQ